MSITVALRLAYVALTLSVLAAVANIGATVLQAPLDPGVAKVLMVAGFVWPVALYVIAVYRRQLKRDAEAGS